MHCVTCVLLCAQLEKKTKHKLGKNPPSSDPLYVSPSFYYAFPFILFFPFYIMRGIEVHLCSIFSSSAFISVSFYQLIHYFSLWIVFNSILLASDFSNLLKLGYVIYAIRKLLAHKTCYNIVEKERLSISNEQVMEQAGQKVHAVDTAV